MKLKRSILKYVAPLVVVLGICVVVYTYYHAPTPTEKIYSDAFLSFTYPPSLIVDEADTAILITHSIVHAHPDVCDMKGDAPPLTTLEDFDVVLQVVPQNLRDAVEGTWWTWEDVSDNPVTIGNFQGYTVTGGVEGCGKEFYYFPISAEKTLVIQRGLVAEFNPINADYQTYLALPGIVPPAQEEEYFLRIIRSLVVH